MAVGSYHPRHWLAVVPVVAALSSAAPVMAQTAMPSFLPKAHVSDIVAARAAIDSATSVSVLEATEAKREAEARLLSQTDELARRAERERAMAAEIRAKAEALSQRFAEELSQDAKSAEAKAKPADKAGKSGAVAAANAGSGTATLASAESIPGQHDERTTETLKRAADALARARSTLDEADRRVAAGKDAPAGTWSKVKAEFAEARRKAAEAVETAQQALGAVPATVAAITGGGEDQTAAATPAADPRKSLPRPYALGGTLR